MRVFTFLILSFYFSVYNANSQNVEIPDPNFLAALIESGVDINGDGIIQVSEAENINSPFIFLSLSYKNISDFTGINAFKNIDRLDLRGNPIETLDISGLSFLKELTCSNSETLTSINISNLSNLEDLSIHNNPSLITLDISNSPNIQELDCSNCALNKLDISQLINLENLNARNNNIEEFIHGTHPVLDRIDLGNNQLQSLNISGCCELLFLIELWINPMTSLDISNNPNLALGAGTLSPDLIYLNLLGINWEIYSNSFDLLYHSSLKYVCIEDSISQTLIEDEYYYYLSGFEDIIFTEDCPISPIDSITQIQGKFTYGECGFCDENSEIFDSIKIEVIGENYTGAGSISFDSEGYISNIPYGEYAVVPSLTSVENYKITPDTIWINNNSPSLIDQNFCVSPIVSNNTLEGLLNFGECGICNSDSPQFQDVEFLLNGPNGAQLLNPTINEDGFTLDLPLGEYSLRPIIPNPENFIITPESIDISSCANLDEAIYQEFCIIPIELVNATFNFNGKFINGEYGECYDDSPLYDFGTLRLIGDEIDSLVFLNQIDVFNVELPVGNYNIIPGGLSTFQYLYYPDTLTINTCETEDISQDFCILPYDKLGDKPIINCSFIIAEDGFCDNSDNQLEQIKLILKGDHVDECIFPEFTGNGFRATVPFGEYRLSPVFENMDEFVIEPEFVDLIICNQSNFIPSFCLTPKSDLFTDVSINLIPLNDARPGFEVRYKLIYHNLGNEVSSGNIRLSFQDSILTFVESNPSMTESEGTLNLFYSDLQPFEQRCVFISFILNSPMDDPPVTTDDFLSFNGLIFPNNDDINRSNNFVDLTQNVVNSFDPNDKTCIQGEYILDTLIKNKIDYVIRFENVGTASAVNIRIEDLIDTVKFDINSLNIINASHSYHANVRGDLVSIFFDNIELPFEDDENDGFIAFEIDLNSDVTVGDTLENTADIYFDFNFPIITNTETSVIVTDSDQDGYHNLIDCDDNNALINPGQLEIANNGIDDNCDGDILTNVNEIAEENWLVISPNPITDIALLSSKSNNRFNIRLFNHLGELVLLEEDVNRLNVTNLDNGSYILEVFDFKQNKTDIQKVIVAR